MAAFRDDDIATRQRAESRIAQPEPLKARPAVEHAPRADCTSDADAMIYDIRVRRTRVFSPPGGMPTYTSTTAIGAMVTKPNVAGHAAAQRLS